MVVPDALNSQSTVGDVAAVVCRVIDTVTPLASDICVAIVRCQISSYSACCRGVSPEGRRTNIRVG